MSPHPHRTYKVCTVVLQLCQIFQQCPYQQMLFPSGWVTVAEGLNRQSCNLVGQSYESPLSVTIGSGVQAFPPLVKFMSVMARNKQE